MSVVAGKRKEGRLKVLVKTSQLAAYTIQICDNEKSFPKRHRWSLTGRIVDAAITVHTLASRANEIYVKPGDKAAARRRYDLQNEALEETFALTALLEIAYNLFGISDDRMEYWTRLVLDTRTLLRGWRDNDVKRYKQSE